MGWGNALLAFTGSPLFAKFFSNLQLLDVVANHQRSSQPICLTSPPSSPTPILRLLPLQSAVSSRPLHLFMCLFIISSAAARRHLVVRTVINSLKPLASSLRSIFTFIPPSLSEWTHECTLLPSCPFYSCSLSLHLP